MFADLIDRADVCMIQRGCCTASRSKRFSACMSEANPSERNFRATKRWSVSVLGFIDDAHTAAAEFINYVVMRDDLADKRGRVCHHVAILGWAKKQVNEARRITGLFDTPESPKGDLASRLAPIR